MNISILFFSSLGISIVIYLLRGFGILTFLPGGLILIPIALSFISGILWGLEITRKY